MLSGLSEKLRHLDLQFGHQLHTSCSSNAEIQLVVNAIAACSELRSLSLDLGAGSRPDNLSVLTMEWFRPLSKLTSVCLGGVRAFGLQAAPHLQMSSLCSGLTHLQLVAWEGGVRLVHTLTGLRSLDLAGLVGQVHIWGSHLTLSTLCSLTRLDLSGYGHGSLCLEGLAQLRLLTLI